MERDEPVLLRRDEDGIAWLTLNRPAQRNALSSALLTALQARSMPIAPRPRGQGGGDRRQRPRLLRRA